MFEVIFIIFVFLVAYRLIYAVYLSFLPVGHPRRVAHVRRERKILGRSTPSAKR